jgi:hypothetical protein
LSLLPQPSRPPLALAISDELAPALHHKIDELCRPTVENGLHQEHPKTMGLIMHSLLFRSRKQKINLAP